jgi:hypothetical protein
MQGSKPVWLLFKSGNQSRIEPSSNNKSFHGDSEEIFEKFAETNTSSFINELSPSNTRVS